MADTYRNETGKVCGISRKPLKSTSRSLRSWAGATPSGCKGQLARARNAHQNPLGTLCSQLEAHKAAGGTLEQALLTVTHLRSFVLSLHGETIDCTDAGIRRVNLAETLTQGAAEDPAQLEVMANPSSLSALESCRAGLLADIAATEAAVVAVTRRIAIEKASHDHA